MGGPGRRLGGWGVLVLPLLLACESAPNVGLQADRTGASPGEGPLHTMLRIRGADDGGPSACAVGGETRPAIGCPDPIPLFDGRVDAEAGVVRAQGGLPSRLWGRRVLLEPRTRADELAGFSRARPAVGRGWPWGFTVEAPLADATSAEVQVLGYAVPPDEWAHRVPPVQIPPRARLDLGLALHALSGDVGAAAVEYRVVAHRGDEARDVLTVRVEAGGGPREWVEATADLSGFAGQTVTLELRSRVVEPGPEGGTAAFPLWGAPRIVAPGPADGRPNVLILSLDTLRGDYFGGVMDGHPMTPLLTEQAREGVRFDQAISTYPSTAAAHMSLLTGTYPSRHGVRFATDTMPDDGRTLAQELAGAGWATGAITENAMLNAGAGFSRGFDRYRENKGLGLWSTEGQIDRTFADGLAWLDAHAGRRFFLFLHTYQVHSPYNPPAAFDLFRREGSAGSDAEPKSNREWAEDQRRLYAGEIRHADATTAALFDGLRRRGLFENTIVILTSDHGEEFVEHDQMGHSKSAYDEVLRVPLVIWAPSVAQRDRRIAAQVSLVDVVPTLAEILGLGGLTGLHGESLAPLLHGERDAPLDEVRFAESPNPKRGGPQLLAVRTGRHKWIGREDQESPAEIYDLVADPGETTPLTTPELVELGREHLARYRESLARGVAPAAARRRELDAETADKLRALGYLD